MPLYFGPIRFLVVQHAEFSMAAKHPDKNVRLLFATLQDHLRKRFPLQRE